jgi:hypothetical protein
MRKAGKSAKHGGDLSAEKKQAEKKQAEKERLKYPERLRKTIGLGVIRIKK